MSASAEAIVDAAERRIRVGGFNGFSFREIAADVGVKSSSVHYHFPTKEKLAAAVVHRYTNATAAFIDGQSATGADPIKVWSRAFRDTLHTHRMCPCTVLAAAALDLPAEVATEVKRFFEMCLARLTRAGLSKTSATEFLSTITGALVVSNALGNTAVYDLATRELAKRFGRSK